MMRSIILLLLTVLFSSPQMALSHSSRPPHLCSLADEIKLLQELPPYDTTPRLAHVRGEEGARYMDAAERSKYEVMIKGGKLKDANGKLLGANGREEFLYVMDAHGNIFIESTKNDLRVHSDFLAGEPVAAAGEIWIENGVVSWINDGSGHYKPKLKFTNQFLKELDARGVDLSNVHVEIKRLKDRAN